MPKTHFRAKLVTNKPVMRKNNSLISHKKKEWPLPTIVNVFVLYFILVYKMEILFLKKHAHGCSQTLLGSHTHLVITLSRS